MLTRLLPLVLAAMLAGCASGENPAIDAGGTPEATATPSVTGTLDAADQTSDGTTLTVTSVTITGAKGFVAVHMDTDGQPGTVIGHSRLLEEGTTEDVKVTLDQKASTGSYWPMLHYDSNSDDRYTFPPDDPPVTAGGRPVMTQVTLTVS